MNVITRPHWEATYYLTDTGRREPVDDPFGADEIERARLVIDELYERGFLPSAGFDEDAFGRLREAVRAKFEIIWTSITPVMERVLYGICAAKQPRAVICCGVFCGNTLIWNVGPLTGPGKVLDADWVVGCEVVDEHVELARRNMAAIGAEADIRCQDGHVTVTSLPQPIDLLYLDATGPKDHPDERMRGKRIYTTLLEAAYPYLADDALIVAHDTLPDWFARTAGCYFDLVRDPARFAASIEVRVDEQGLEVTRR